MSMDLNSVASGKNFRFNNQSWRMVLHLANMYGWQPEHDVEHYMYNQGNVVSKADAMNIAKAIEEALPAIPFAPNMAHTLIIYKGLPDDANKVKNDLLDMLKRVLGDVDPRGYTAYPHTDELVSNIIKDDPLRAVQIEGLEDGTHFTMSNPNLTAVEFFAGDKQRLTEFILFCRLGDFAIW